jgi:hypothetical protein
MEPWEEEVARGRALVWLPWVCLEDCFACATCCRKRVERSEGSSAGLACALRAAERQLRATDTRTVCHRAPLYRRG